jgi:iron complex outermembrane receptor protein
MAWKFQAGVRYDLAHMDITGFYDNTLAGYLQEQGYTPDIVKQYARRAYDVNRNSGNFSGGVTAEYHPKVKGRLSFKLNLAKSLRFPSANELAANGVHHAAFRYEIGNPDLNPENGYIVDFETYYACDRKLEIVFNPFFTYYSNYIFLRQVAGSPVDLYDEQPYKYSQAKAIYGGGEYKVLWRFAGKLQLTTSGSLVLNRNIDDGNPLPFTPPFTMANEIKFLDDARSRKDLSYYQISLSHHWYADQNRVGEGEERTKGCNLFDFSAGIVYQLDKKWTVDVNMQVENIFNTRYLNHMSLYRRLNIPEQGRSFRIFVRIPFKG